MVLGQIAATETLGWRRRRRAAAHTGMEVMPMQPPLPPDSSSQDCIPRQPAPLFATKAEADAAVLTARQADRLDIGSNHSFRDPIIGEITGFDVDIAAAR